MIYGRHFPTKHDFEIGIVCLFYKYTLFNWNVNKIYDETTSTMYWSTLKTKLNGEVSSFKKTKPICSFVKGYFFKDFLLQTENSSKPNKNHWKRLHKCLVSPPTIGARFFFPTFFELSFIVLVTKLIRSFISIFL